MARAVSVALTIMETTKLPSWRDVAEAVRQGEPRTSSSLLTLDIEPHIAELLAQESAILDLIRYGPGGGGKKPTTTTLLTCTICARWLIGTATSGTPACVLTTGCTGKLSSAKKAAKVSPDDPAAAKVRADIADAATPTDLPEATVEQMATDSPEAQAVSAEKYSESADMFD